MHHLAHVHTRRRPAQRPAETVDAVGAAQPALRDGRIEQREVGRMEDRIAEARNGGDGGKRCEGMGEGDQPQTTADDEQAARQDRPCAEAVHEEAGRELRVIVESEKVNDDRAAELSFEISQKIQTEMTYPGQIKITVIREKRSVNYAK